MKQLNASPDSKVWAWTENEKRYLVECGTTKTLHELASKLKRSHASVKRMRQRLKLGTLRNHNKWEHDEIAFLRNNAGKMVTDMIAKELGRTVASVRGKAMGLGIPLLCIGENSPFAIHSDEDVLLCRQLRDEGLSIKVIANKMEISVATVAWFIYGSRMTQQDRIMLEFDREKNQ